MISFRCRRRRSRRLSAHQVRRRTDPPRDRLHHVAAVPGCGVFAWRPAGGWVPLEVSACGRLGVRESVRDGQRGSAGRTGAERALPLPAAVRHRHRRRLAVDSGGRARHIALTLMLPLTVGRIMFLACPSVRACSGGGILPACG